MTNKSIRYYKNRGVIVADSVALMCADQPTPLMVPR